MQTLYECSNITNYRRIKLAKDQFVRCFSYVNFSGILRITTKPFGKGRVETESHDPFKRKALWQSRIFHCPYIHTHKPLYNLGFRKGLYALQQKAIKILQSSALISSLDSSFFMNVHVSFQSLSHFQNYINSYMSLSLTRHQMCCK